jgi:hypothetical protein
MNDLKDCDAEKLAKKCETRLRGLRITRRLLPSMAGDGVLKEDFI